MSCCLRISQSGLAQNSICGIIAMMKFSSAFLILTTACLRVLPLSSTRRVDPPHQGGGPKPVNFKKFIIIRISRFWWWMRSGSEVDSPGVSKDAFEAERKSEKHVPGRMKFRPHPEGGLGRTRTVVCLIVSEYQFRFFPSLSHQYICRLHRNCS